MQELLIDSISTAEGVQSRTKTDSAYVTELAELIKEGKRLPPIEVFRDGKTNRAADGFHRILAHVVAGKKTIRCNVHKGGVKEACLASTAANQQHGLRRSQEDKRKAVNMTLALLPEKSDQFVANHCGVCRQLVWTLRQSRKVSTCMNIQVDQRTGVDGKTRRIPPPPPAREDVTQPAATPNRRPPPPAPPPTPKDELGHTIPDHLTELFERGREIQEHLTVLGDLRTKIVHACDNDDDQLYAELNLQPVQAAFQTIIDQLKATKPYAVCPWCHGVTSSSCKGCGKRGVVGKYRWDTTVPRELKK